MADIIDCRTPALGGSLFVCDTCDGLDYAYHSCRNRHCPKCHYGPSQLWLEGLRGRLLPCPYYFITFTLPAELRPLARSHQSTVYDLLLREAAAALQHLADDPKWVGAKLGILAVLHTWSRDLSYHPHVHLLATAGGLTDQGEAWRKPAHSRFLVPGYALSTIFRAKVRDALDRENLLSSGRSGGLPQILERPSRARRRRRARRRVPLPLCPSRRPHQRPHRSLRARPCHFPLHQLAHTPDPTSHPSRPRFHRTLSPARPPQGLSKDPRLRTLPPGRHSPTPTRPPTA